MRNQTIIGAVLMVLGIVILFSTIIFVGVSGGFGSGGFGDNSEIWGGVFLIILVSLLACILPGYILLYKEFQKW